MGGQVEKRRGPRRHKKTFRFLIQLSLCWQRHVVLEGVENMGSTGGIRAISLAFAQNWSGPAVWRSRVLCRAPRRPTPPLRPPPLCAFVFFQDFFCHVGLLFLGGTLPRGSWEKTISSLSWTLTAGGQVHEIRVKLPNEAWTRSCQVQVGKNLLGFGSGNVIYQE